jgi:hypothetical protein
MAWTKDDVGPINGVVGTDAERQAIADDWNAQERIVVERKLIDEFKIEGLSHIAAIEPEFDTIGKVEILAAMSAHGMLEAFANWDADGKLVGNLYLYVRDEAIKRVRGTGGHPDLTIDQLNLIDPTAAMPFAGVDGSDPGWPTQ